MVQLPLAQAETFDDPAACRIALGAGLSVVLNAGALERRW